MLAKWAVVSVAMAGLALPLTLQDGALRAAGAAETAPHKIITQWKGAAMPLDVFNGGEFDNFVHLAPAAKVSGQDWTMRAEGDGTFRLTTDFRGPDLCLDVVNGGAMDGFVKLTACGNFSGQFWSSEDEGGWLRLRPQFRKLCLDVVNGGPHDGMAHMAECGDFSGQHWKIE